MRALIESYVKILRKILPASKNAVAWRHDDIVARLGSVETRLDAIARELQLQRSRELEYRGVPPLAGQNITPKDQNEILSVVRLLEPQRAVGFEKVRVGSPGDGGYIQLNDTAGISTALSFGVFNDDNWDLAMARMGISVQQFDNSIAQSPSQHPLLHFNRKTIAPRATADAATIPDLVAAHSKPGPPDLILKSDIDGAEWDVFDQSSGETLARFSQIMCEFHGFSRLAEPPFRARAIRVFRKLGQQFAVIHVHANNGSPLINLANIAIPDVLEISYANRERYSFTATDEIFPTSLDRPNASNAADIRLGSFRF